METINSLKNLNTQTREIQSKLGMSDDILGTMATRISIFVGFLVFTSLLNILSITDFYFEGNTLKYGIPLSVLVLLYSVSYTRGYILSILHPYN
mgnify:FL=1